MRRAPQHCETLSLRVMFDAFNHSSNTVPIVIARTLKKNARRLQTAGILVVTEPQY